MTDLNGHVQAWVASQSSPHTRDAYAREAHQWLDWCETNGVDPLTPDRAHLNTWKESPTARRDTPSPATRARRIAAISSLYTYLAREGYVSGNPFVGMDRPTTERRISGKPQHTDYGFEWGPVQVTRLWSRPDGSAYVVGISTSAGHSLDIYVSRTGRSVRVYRNGDELKPAG